MAGPLPSPILDLIRRAADAPRLKVCPDVELLRRFASDRDAAAFGEIVRRHGPVVIDVCRGLLRNEADVEDAFQATFLVLARKAASIRSGDSLASWLHGVAYRAGQRSRTEFARRGHAQSPPPDCPAPPCPDELSWREVRGVLHEELSRLPERLRGPLVLCYLEGMSHDRAAAALGLPKGTLKGRLERGRELLHARLVRRGVGPAAVLAAAVWPLAATAGVPPALAGSVVRVATAVAAGAATPPVTTGVAELTTGVMKAMSTTRLKIATAVLLAAGAVCGGGAAALSVDRPTTAPPTKDALVPGGGSGQPAKDALVPGGGSGQPAKDALVPEDGKDAKPAEVVGIWAFVSIEGRGPDGKRQTKMFDGDADTVTVTGNRKKWVQFTRGGDGKGTKVGEYDIEVDAGQKPPRLTLQTTHEDKAKIRYVYEVKGDTLRLCFYAVGAGDGGDAAWPDGFDLDKLDVEKHPTLHTFKRIGPKR
ncbi:MAG: hypothetical protein C0501_31230 [Isosphaera sp.]|nr:hypothetical protein [Isosphaera sp.]